MWTVSIETATPRSDGGGGDGPPAPEIDCVGRLVVALYGEKGGSDDMPLMNDVDATQRLKPNQTDVFKVRAETRGVLLLDLLGSCHFSALRFPSWMTSETCTRFVSAFKKEQKRLKSISRPRYM